MAADRRPRTNLTRHIMLFFDAAFSCVFVIKAEESEEMSKTNVMLVPFVTSHKSDLVKITQP